MQESGELNSIGSKVFIANLFWTVVGFKKKPLKSEIKVFLDIWLICIHFPITLKHYCCSVVPEVISEHSAPALHLFGFIWNLSDDSASLASCVCWKRWFCHQRIILNLNLVTSIVGVENILMTRSKFINSNRKCLRCLKCAYHTCWKNKLVMLNCSHPSSASGEMEGILQIVLFLSEIM